MIVSTDHHLRIILATICIGITMQVNAGDDVTPIKGNRIQLLGAEVLSQETPPFLEYRDPAAIEAQLREPVDTTASKQSPTPELLPVASAVTELIAADELQAARGQLRESMTRDGKTSAAHQDDLTAEFFSVMRWTVLALIVGGLGAVTLKKMPQFKTPSVSGTKMKIVETLPLGRNQILNLVQAGGERFLIATDPAGIKSVTLLPNWPDADHETEDSPIAEVPPSKPSSSRFPPFERSLTDTRSA